MDNAGDDTVCPLAAHRPPGAFEFFLQTDIERERDLIKIDIIYQIYQCNLLGSYTTLIHGGIEMDYAGNLETSRTTDQLLQFS